MEVVVARRFSPILLCRLRALVISTMNGDECHEMLNLLSQRLHRDIFGDLPLELAALVASYLEPSETIQFRRVCHRRFYKGRRSHGC